ncbi:MAG: hypothetical protein IKN87_00505 [Bacilli bacterium]|nr:hypothetical protein [Bacilli bacterium]
MDNNDRKTILAAMEKMIAPNLDLEEQGTILEIQEVAEEIKGFYYYVSFRKAAAKSKLDFLLRHEERKKNGLGSLPRTMRRQINKKLPSTNVLPKAIRELKYLYEMTDRLKEAMEDEKSLDNDDSFCQLVMMNVLFKKDNGILKKLGLETNNAIDFFVKQAKEQNSKCYFLKCFDEEGKVLPEMAYYLRTIIYDKFKDIYSRCNVFAEITQEECLDFLISEEVLKQADEIARIKNEQRIIEEQKIKEEKRLEREREEQIRKSRKKEEVVIKRTYNEMDELYKKIITPGKYTLRKGIDEVMSLEELETILNRLTNIPNDDKQKFINEYLIRVYTRRLNYVMKISSKVTLKKIRNILNNEKNNLELFEAFRNILQNDTFEELTDEQIMDSIESVLNDKYLKETNKTSNFIIFPSNDLVSNESNRVFESKSFEDKERVIKGFKNHLITLVYHDINEIRSNKSNAFHELKTEKRESYTLDDKLKGYRFGPRKTKVGLFIISVDKDNQEKLKEIYKTNINANVILVFGLGNVNLEKEFDMYNRIIKFGNQNKEIILHINDIFANPFTEDTLKEARNLIDNGFLAIDQLGGVDDPTNVNKCPILK